MSAPALADDTQICTSVPSVPTDDMIFIAGNFFSLSTGFYGWNIRPGVNDLLTSGTAYAAAVYVAMKF